MERPGRACYPLNVSWQTTVPERAAELTIGALCARLALSARTVRYYEELGLLPGVRRRAGGRRVYGPDELERLRFIQHLKALGLSLAQIRELNAVHAIGGSTRAMLTRLDELLAQRLADTETRLAEIARLRDEIAKYRGRVTSRIGALGASRRKRR
jgi:DNA-binding transcriptional MerR regulator